MHGHEYGRTSELNSVLRVLWRERGGSGIVPLDVEIGEAALLALSR